MVEHRLLLIHVLDRVLDMFKGDIGHLKAHSLYSTVDDSSDELEIGPTRNKN